MAGRMKTGPFQTWIKLLPTQKTHDMTDLTDIEINAKVARAQGWHWMGELDIYPGCWLDGEGNEIAPAGFNPLLDWRDCGPLIARFGLRHKYDLDEDDAEVMKIIRDDGDGGEVVAEVPGWTDNSLRHGYCLAVIAIAEGASHE